MRKHSNLVKICWKYTPRRDSLALMFTGIIQDIGTIRTVDKSGGDLRFEIATKLDISNIEDGASICCSGCCLTVVKKTNDSFFVDVSRESLDKTVLGHWEEGTKINLEPSLKLGDELGGHFVFGHVDAVTEIADIREEGGSHRLTIKTPESLKRFIASKGSVALDGISLTVNEVEHDTFGVNIIPHTWDVTTLGSRKVGDKMNIEIDMLARYVARSLEVAA